MSILRTIGFDQPDSEDVDVIDLPAVGRPVKSIVHWNRLSASLDDPRTHFNFRGRGIRAQRAEFNPLILHQGQCPGKAARFDDADK